MTAPTSPWSIPLFAATDTLPSLEGVLNSISNAVNTALNTINANTVLNYTTLTNLNAVAGTYLGQQATVDADSTTTNNGIYSWSGSVWRMWNSDWFTFTPTLTNITVGTTGAVNAFKYRYESGEIHVRGQIVLGTGGSVGTTPTMTLPVNSAALSVAYQGFVGTNKYTSPTATINYLGSVAANNTSVSAVILRSLSGTGVSEGNLTASVPFTWAVGCGLTFDFWYDHA